jgi:hypothetical protein
MNSCNVPNNFPFLLIPKAPLHVFNIPEIPGMKKYEKSTQSF